MELKFRFELGTDPAFHEGNLNRISCGNKIIQVLLTGRMVNGRSVMMQKAHQLQSLGENRSSSMAELNRLGCPQPCMLMGRKAFNSELLVQAVC